MNRIENIDWNDLNTYLFVIGYSMILVPLFKRELLAKRKSFLMILLFSIIIFLIALISDMLNYDKIYYGLLFLYTPLYIVVWYRFLRFVFIRIEKREPIDTTFYFKDFNHGADMLFNILYFITATIIPMIFFVVRRLN